MNSKSSPIAPMTRREILIENQMISLVLEKKKKENSIVGVSLLPSEIKTKLKFKASEKAINAVALKSLSFKLDDSDQIEGNFTNADIDYEVDGANIISIGGIKRDNPEGTALGVKLVGGGKFFELQIISRTQWTFTARSILTTEGESRAVANPPIEGFGDFLGQIETKKIS